MIKSIMDIEKFTNKFKNHNAEPLSALTKGVHLHTIKADNEEIMECIIKQLKDRDYLISDC